MSKVIPISRVLSDLKVYPASDPRRRWGMCANQLADGSRVTHYCNTAHPEVFALW
jgi:hypothetical protein